MDRMPCFELGDVGSIPAGPANCNGGREAQCTGLQILKTACSNHARCSNLKDPMWEYVITFFALFFTDIFYTYYLRSIQNERALAASVWAVIVFVIASVAVINYTTDHWLLIPACMGAFCGTWVGMRLRKIT
jgi:hypothetical protein